MENNPTSKYDLLYFSNNNIYKQVDKIIENPNNEEDIKFYKKRIIYLTKQLLKKEIETTTSISESFNNYINQTIMHFKFIDKKDMLQKEYDNIEIKKPKPKKDFKLENENQKLLIKKISKPKTMNDYIIQKNKKIKKYLPPKVKNYNIKTDNFKKKGINKEKSK
jgi:hypothetical protein